MSNGSKDQRVNSRILYGLNNLNHETMPNHEDKIHYRSNANNSNNKFYDFQNTSKNTPKLKNINSNSIDEKKSKNN